MTSSPPSSCRARLAQPIEISLPKDTPAADPQTGQVATFHHVPDRVLSDTQRMRGAARGRELFGVNVDCRLVHALIFARIQTGSDF
jgi:hypothetical protein